MQRHRTAFAVLVIGTALRIAVANGASGSFKRSSGQQHTALDAAAYAGANVGAAEAAREMVLRSKLVSADRDRRQLRLHLDQVTHVAHEEVTIIKNGLEMAKTAALRSEAKLQFELKRAASELEKTNAALAADEARATAAERELAAQANSLDEAKANVSRLAAASSATAQEIQRDRLGLLEQISELKNETKRFHQAEILANQQVATVKKQADDTRIAQNGGIRRLSAEHQQELSMLQSVVEASRANASSVLSSSEGLRRKVVTLRQTLSRQQIELRSAETERDEVQTARDASSKAEATLRASLSKAQLSIEKQRQEAAATQRRYEDAERRATASAKRATELKEMQKSLEAELADMNSTLGRQTARSQEQLHQTILAAAARVHALEDGGESAEAELEKQKKALAVANANLETLQSDLRRETNEAVEASRNATEASAELASVAESKRQALEKVDALAPKVASLQAERDHLAVDLKARDTEFSQLQAQQEDSNKDAQDAQKKVQRLEKETHELKDKLANLVGESQRADDLDVQVVSLRKEADDRAKRDANLRSEIDRLRDLKESYSLQSDLAQKESSSLRAHAEDLDAKVASVTKELHRVTQQRDDALASAREARKQEDEYFDENTRLQQQTEESTQKLEKASEASNRSEEAVRSLQAEVESAKAESVRQQSNSKAAWLANQKELIEVRQELADVQSGVRSLKADIDRTQRELTVPQRKKLGLPVPKEATAAENPPAKTQSHDIPKKTQAHVVVALQATKLMLKVNASGRTAPGSVAHTTQASRGLRVKATMVPNRSVDAIPPSANLTDTSRAHISQVNGAMRVKAPINANRAADAITPSANLTVARSVHASHARGAMRLTATMVANHTASPTASPANRTAALSANSSHVVVSPTVAPAGASPLAPTSTSGSPLLKLAEYFSAPAR